MDRARDNAQSLQAIQGGTNDECAFQTLSKDPAISTVKEQRRYAALVPSNYPRAWRVNSIQQPAPIVALCERRHKETAICGRRGCASLDELAVYDRRRWNGSAQVTSSLSTDQSPQRVNTNVTKASAPPFLPPERVKTPDGVPSWHGQRAPELSSRHIDTSVPGTRPFLRRLRIRSSRVFTHLFGGLDYEERTRERHWRPPTSGHATMRYEDLSSHPFARALLVTPSSNAPGPDSCDDRQYQEANTHSAVRSGGQAVEQAQAPLATVVRYNVKSDSVISPSQRALYSANGNAIPVSPRRAFLHTRAAEASRSVSLPKWQFHRARDQDSNRGAGQGPCTPDSTVDLIRQFPTPPMLAHHDERNCPSGLASLSASNALG